MVLSIGSSCFVMPFLARLLLSLSCLLMVAGPATAAGLRTMGDTGEPVSHCQHQEPADHGAHGDPGDRVQGVHTGCDGGSSCASHCTPVMIVASAGQRLVCGDMPVGAAPTLLAGITAIPELRPPRS